MVPVPACGLYAGGDQPGCAAVPGGQIRADAVQAFGAASHRHGGHAVHRLRGKGFHGLSPRFPGTGRHGPAYFSVDAAEKRGGGRERAGRGWK